MKDLALSARVQHLEGVLMNMPRFTAVQLGALVDGIELWQEVSSADGRQVVAELRRSVQALLGQGNDVAELVAMCADCGEPLQLVRPGKWQCLNCQ